MRTRLLLLVIGAFAALLWITATAPLVSLPPAAGVAAAPRDAAPPAGGCPAHWDVIDTPNAGSGGSLGGIAVVAPNDIWAMGSADAHPLLVHGDGTQWTEEPVPLPPYRSSGFSAGAALGGEVWMAGTGTNGCCYRDSVVYYRNGSTWNLLPQITGRSLSIAGVAAIGPGAAWVVGTRTVCNSCPTETIIMLGSPTTLDRVPSPNWGNRSSLTAVAVTNSTDAWSVGYWVNATTTLQETLIERWNGTAWTIVPSPNVSGTNNILLGVAVAGTNDVWAVGGPADYPYANSLPLIEHWDGTAWSIVPNPGQPGDFLKAVSASSPSNVWAVGTDDTLNTLTLHWDGTAWTRVTSPTFYSNSNFNAVAALGPSDVWSVGSFYQPDVSDQTLVAHYTTACPAATPTATPVPVCPTGWHDVSSPNLGSDNTALQSIAAVTDDDLWAVGQHGTTSAHQTLITHRVGGNWSVVSSPNPSPADTYLNDLSVVTANDIWAVGESSHQSLIEHWDGTSWTIVPAPAPGNGGPTTLSAIEARAADDIWAVGTHETSVFPYAETLTLHWDGTAWAVVPSPAIQNQYLEFYGVSALGPNDVWAVGYHKNYSIDITTLIAHWDGTGWTTIPSPNAATHNKLWGVAALAPNNVWAVGEQEEGDQVLIEHWDGTAWTIVPSTQTGGLYGLAARNANDIWAVGKADHAGRTSLTMHWDGTTWTTVLGPGEGSNFTKLRGVIVTGTDSAWTVGTIAGNGRPYQSLIGRYYGNTSPCASPTPSSSNTPTTVPVPSQTATANPTATPVLCLSAQGDQVLCTTTPTPTHTPTRTPSATPIPTTCAIAFADVPLGSTFYEVVRCLACRGIVSGYPCGGPGEPCPGAYYRPGNNVTRGQTSKIVAAAAGFADPVPSTQQTFEDVPPGSTFGIYVERLVMRGVIGGYPCGGVGEPCVAPANRPYFRPNNDVTRGQLAKIVSGAAGWTETPTTQTFADVGPGSTFYLPIERMASRGIIGGYPCGGVGEPCLAPGNRAYFRPNNQATRGQMSKIAAQTFLPNCQTPAAAGPIRR